MSTPLDNITDGYEFQRIVAEYFRWLKKKEHQYQIADIDVIDNGIGGDDGCDIIVEFFFEDAIQWHSQKWVIECKGWKKAICLSDLDTNNLKTIMDANNAKGYLLICKNDATTKLKRLFKEKNKNGEYRFEIWSGTNLWHRFIKSADLLKAFFPIYHRFIETQFENYDDLIETYSKQLKNKK